MVEFGEQLRKAREAKGMTQQTLAEHLYVTRQAVSRWECGDRYPDLIMAKKLADFLEVSLDDLLSADEMKKVAERNQIIEKPLMKRVLLVLYACISFSFLLTVVDIMMRFPVSSKAVDYSDIQVIVVNVLGLLTESIIFIYGFIMALKENLTPKKTGMIITIYFVTLCLTNSWRMSYIGGLGWKYIIADSIFIIPSLLGAVAAYQYFCSTKMEPVWYRSIIVVSGWEILLILMNTYSIISADSQFISMNAALNLLLKVCIYLLIIYQTYIMKRKRKHAIDISVPLEE